MTDDIIKRMAALDAAEELLAGTNVRGISTSFRAQMDLNRLLIDGARDCLEQAAGKADDSTAC